MKFLLSVAGFIIAAILAASLEVRGTYWLASTLGMEVFGGRLILATFVFIASQWHFLKAFSPKNSGALDYAANLLGVVACGAAFYGFTADTTRQLNQTYRAGLRDVVSFGSAAATRYEIDFCSGTLTRTPETSVTCELTRKAQQVLGEGSLGMTAGRVRSFIDKEIVPHDLHGQLRPASPWDLKAFIPKPGPRAITEFNVLYSYLESAALMSAKAQQYQRSFDELRWARFLGSSDGRQIELWLAFNAILMKLGVVLLKSLERRDDI